VCESLTCICLCAGVHPNTSPQVIWRFGGLYVDTDFECLHSFEELHTRLDFFAALSNVGALEISNGIFGMRVHTRTHAHTHTHTAARAVISRDIYRQDAPSSDAHLCNPPPPPPLHSCVCVLVCVCMCVLLPVHAPARPTKLRANDTRWCMPPSTPITPPSLPPASPLNSNGSACPPSHQPDQVHVTSSSSPPNLNP
jgi:hypothetical protein